MGQKVGVVSIPASFETLRDAVGPDHIGQVLLECPEDLEAVKKALAEVGSAGQGKLLFLRGTPGAGKTSLAESVPVFLSDTVGHILTPPADYELPITELPRWISKNLDQARREAAERVILINLDRREIPVIDEVATQAAMGNLNGLLRTTPKVLLVWPVNSQDFAKAAVERLKLAGGETALSGDPIHELRGLPMSRYSDALQLLLDATNVKLEDAAITPSEVDGMLKEGETIGQFLRRVQALVVARYDLGELGTTLPRLSIIVSSNDDTYNTCRLLRRGSRFLVDPDKLLQFSRANVAEDWRRRGAENPRRGLGFISSLFEVRLLNLSSSAVVNACAWGTDADLQEEVRRYYAQPVRANAANSMRNSALARALRGEDDVGFATSKTSAEIRKAYLGIQGLTNAKHRQINESIVKVLTDQLSMSLPNLTFEWKPLESAGKGLTVDAWSSSDGRPVALEFTHRRDGDAALAVIASYVLTKIQDYARDYGLL
jgi:hypothetical protein